MKPDACLRCGADLDPHPGPGRPKLYCSRRCRSDSQKEPDHRSCLHCGDSIELPVGKRGVKPRFCSRKCAEAARRTSERRPRSIDLRQAMKLYEAALALGWIGVASRAHRSVVAGLRDRDGDRCQLCGDEIDFTVDGGVRHETDGATIDHVRPRSLGGSSAPRNLQLAHWSCNRAKGNRVA